MHLVILCKEIIYQNIKNSPHCFLVLFSPDQMLFNLLWFNVILLSSELNNRSCHTLWEFVLWEMKSSPMAPLTIMCACLAALLLHFLGVVVLFLDLLSWGMQINCGSSLNFGRTVSYLVTSNIRGKLVQVWAYASTSWNKPSHIFSLIQLIAHFTRRPLQQQQWCNIHPLLLHSRRQFLHRFILWLAPQTSLLQILIITIEDYHAWFIRSWLLAWHSEE